MKKLLIVVLALALVFTFISCDKEAVNGPTPGIKKPVTVNAPGENTPAHSENTDIPTVLTEGNEPPTAPLENTDSPVINPESITLESAKATALNHSGLNADDVKFLRAELDRDDGRISYEIEFYRGTSEFEYDIDAVTGEIIKAEKDDVNILTMTPDPSLISEADAKEKALTHAGLTENEISFFKSELDRDDGRISYEIEFKNGNFEYEYDIDAVTGEIIKSEKEIND